jgi:hypothetical protein
MLQSGSRDDTECKARELELGSDMTVFQSSLAMRPWSISAAAEGRLRGGGGAADDNDEVLPPPSGV